MKLDANTSVQELLRSVRATALAAYAVEELPLDRVIEVVQPERDLAYHPIFQTMFALHEPGPQQMKWAGLDLAVEAQEDVVSRFDLMLEMSESDGQIVGRLTCSVDLFDAVTVARWAGHLEYILRTISEEPDILIGDIDLLSVRERKEITENIGGATAAGVPADLIHDVFERQALQAGDAVAVEGDRSLMADLNRRANRLARFLRDPGSAARRSCGGLHASRYGAH